VSGPDLATRAKRLAYDAKTWVARYPIVAMPLARLRHRGVVLSDDTEVVIEGFPRSGNSFAVAAFDMPQPRPLRIAHHTHAPAQVIEACRRNVPTMVLVRDPDQAALNLALYHEGLSLPQALRSYISFHDTVWPFRAGFSVAPFPEVTTDFGASMRRLNERFGTTFVTFEHTEESAAKVFDAMDSFWRGQVGEGERFERLVGRPSASRDAKRDALRPELDRPELRVLRERARRLYGRFCEEAK
jgi:hypothetical protein